MNRRKLFWIVFFNVFLPLVIGLSVYLIYKPGLFPLLSNIPHNVALSNKNFFIKLLVNTGADFCWSYSFASALFIINFLLFRSKLLFYATVLIIILSEVIQIFLPHYFTFDWIDMFVGIMAVGLSYLVIKSKLE